MKPRKIPLRRCSGSGESKPKRELVRVVRAQDGTVSLDLTGKKPGRGAYVCPSAACLAKARKAKRIERALEVSIPEEIYNAMTAEIARAETQRAGAQCAWAQQAETQHAGVRQAVTQHTGAPQSETQHASARQAEAQHAGAEKARAGRAKAEPAAAQKGETDAG